MGNGANLANSPSSNLNDLFNTWDRRKFRNPARKLRNPFQKQLQKLLKLRKFPNLRKTIPETPEASESAQEPQEVEMAVSPARRELDPATPKFRPASQDSVGHHEWGQNTEASSRIKNQIMLARGRAP